VSGTDEIRGGESYHCRVSLTKFLSYGAMYSIITVPDEAGDILEQLGTKPKLALFTVLGDR
jgi:hypothetical protein